MDALFRGKRRLGPGRGGVHLRERGDAHLRGRGDVLMPSQGRRRSELRLPCLQTGEYTIIL